MKRQTNLLYDKNNPKGGVASKTIRKGNKVIAIAGNEKGKVGTVLSRKADRAIVQGLNFCLKCVKKSEQNPQGDRLKVEKSIHLSNLKLYIGEDQS